MKSAVHGRGLVEVRISTDLSSEGTSNCSNDSWSYDEIFIGKKESLLVPENTPLPFIIFKTGLSSEHESHPSGQVDNVCTYTYTGWAEKNVPSFGFVLQLNDIT